MEHQNLICKLKLKPGQTYAHIMDMKDKGGRFVMFIQLTAIPPLFVIVRPSPMFFLEPGEDIRLLRRKYIWRNILMAFLGPFNGFFQMALAGSFNSGGADMTLDAYANLYETEFNAGIIVIRQTVTGWQMPDSGFRRGIRKCISRLEKQSIIFRNPALVMQGTTGNENMCYIGLGNDDFRHAAELRLLLSKEFYAHVRIEIIHLDDAGTEEVSAMLRQYGEVFPPRR